MAVGCGQSGNRFCVNINKEFSLQATSIDSGHTIQVQFGDLCCALTCHDADIFQRLKESYWVFQSDELADVNIRLNIVNRLDPARIEALLSQTMAFPPEGQYRAGNQVFDIEFDAASSTFAVIADRCAFYSSFKLKPMNRLFRLAYYTASQLKHRGRPSSMLVHSCGILRNGKVSLFAGPSETGKSTIGRLCSEDYGLPLNDEMMLLSWSRPLDRSLLVHSVPIFGELPFRLNVSVPLARVFMLRQSQRTAVRRLERKEAYLRFMYQIINPARFRQTDKRAIFSLIAEFTDEVTKVTPFYELEFTRDRNLLWEVETRIAELNGREE
jgi:hypothetical protein